MATYKRGKDFPAEQFVQLAIEADFSRRGFTIEAAKHIDLVCVHPSTGERWQVEAKGISTAMGLDFKTGLGQLIQRMKNRDVKHAVAVPKISPYLAQIAQMDQWVVDHLNIHWLIVDQDGSVQTIAPTPPQAGSS